MEKIVVDDGWILYEPHFLAHDKATEIFYQLLPAVPWQSGKIKIFGKEHQIPRLQALFGDVGQHYGYSGKDVQRNDWLPILLSLKDEITRKTNHNFNVCLANLYRDGKDSNGWHADNEKSLGENPVIASLSFGAERLFKLKHNTTKETLDFRLPSGSLLVMGGALQANWKHTLPKTSKKVNPRINLTFRQIV